MILRRKFLKTLGISFLTFISLPYKFLYSETKKIINRNLSEEQKNKHSESRKETKGTKSRDN